jgi:hypothetical protein
MINYFIFLFVFYIQSNFSSNCHSPATVATPALALVAQTVNNYTKSEIIAVPGSNGIVYFLKKEFKQCRKAGRSIWQSPSFS